MAQWGRNNQGVTVTSSTTKETSNGAPIGTYALVKGGKTGSGTPVSAANADFGNTSPGSKASIDVAMYGNTTVGAFINNMAVGVFSVNAAQMNVTGGALDIGFVLTPGSGYAANTSVTLTVTNGGSSGVVNAHVTTGHVDALNIQTTGSGYITAPTVAIAAPSSINITANSTGFANGSVAGASNSSFKQTNNTVWQVGDRLYYAVPTANTPIAPLTGNTYYYVSFANSTVIKLAATAGGANIAITDTRTTGAAETHTFTGDTATGYVDVASVYPTVTHAGWVLRKEGTGGRAGRVFYETLVAGGSIGVNTATSTGVVGNIDTVVSNTQNDPFV